VNRRQAARENKAPLGSLRNGRVTVVLPTYNRAHLLPQAIESTLAQTARDSCDVVVVDDGSTDNTPAIAQRYRAEITYIRKRNGGLAAARNTALRCCPNEFTALLDDDDLWEPDKIERQRAAFRQWPDVVLVGGRTIDLFPDGRRAPHPTPPIRLDYPADFAPLLVERQFLPPSSVTLRTEAVLAAGLFHPKLRWAEDFHLFARLACHGPCVYLSSVLATYRVGTPGALSANARAMQNNQLTGRRLLQRDLRRRPDCHRYWNCGLARSFSDLREVAYRQGRFREAARWALCALLHRPLKRRLWEWRRLVESGWRAAYNM
jgi:glycosyltransferase involved in cell wall biosynthesis